MRFVHISVIVAFVGAMDQAAEARFNSFSLGPGYSMGHLPLFFGSVR